MWPSTYRNKAAHALLTGWLTEQRDTVQPGHKRGDSRLVPGSYAYDTGASYKTYSSATIKAPPLQVDVLCLSSSAHERYNITFSRMAPKPRPLFAVWAMSFPDATMLHVFNNEDADYAVVHMPEVFKNMPQIAVQRPFLDGLFVNAEGYM